MAAMANTNSSNWGVNETYKLLELWSKESVQSNLVSMKRNIDVYNQIASEMNGFGYQRTGFQCQSKIKKMKVVYRKLKARVDSNQPIIKKWQYYEIFDKVLGGNAEDLPQVASILAEIMGERNGTGLEDTEDSHDEGHEDELLDNSRQLQIRLTRELATSEGSSSPVSSRMLEEPPVRLASRSPPQKDTTNSDFVVGCSSEGRKRKRVEKKKVVALLSDLVEKVVEAKVKSDLKMVELEEKRIRLEEKRMERESELRREEREFQLRMLQCMMESQLGRASQDSGVVMSNHVAAAPANPTITCPTSGTAETEVHMQF